MGGAGGGSREPPTSHRRGWPRSLFTSQRLRTLIARENASDLDTLAHLAESGAIRPVIDRTYPLADAAEAIRNIASGHATGKAVVVI